jgi:hypothetical protein
MKYLLSIIFLFVISFTNAQVLDSIASKSTQVVTTTKEAVKDGVAVVDTSSNFKHIYTDIKTGITALAQGLKVGVEHVYMVLVKQQIVNSVVYLFMFILAIVSIIICYKQWGKIEVVENGSEVKEVRPLVGTITFGALGFILSLVFLFNIDTMIMGFVNPEYGAIQQIISVVKTGDLEKQCETCK